MTTEDLQEFNLQEELIQFLKRHDQYDEVSLHEDHLEPNLAVGRRIFVKFRKIDTDTYWVVYIRKNVCEVYKTTQFGYTAGRYSAKTIKCKKGKTEKPAWLVIKEVMQKIENT